MIRVATRQRCKSGSTPTIKRMLRRRRSPAEVLARLETAEKTLVRIEARNQGEATAGWDAAKASLRLGDERGYQKAAMRYATATRKAGIAGGMIEALQGLKIAVEAQIDLEQIVAIGDEMEHTQKELGLDADRLHRLRAHLRDGMDVVNQAAVFLVATLRNVSWGETTSKDLERIHEELLAEIERETTTRMRVKRDLYDEDRRIPSPR